MGDHIFSVRCIMEDFIEDAATGSANGNLAGYLLSYGYFGSSPISYTIHQGEIWEESLFFISLPTGNPTIGSLRLAEPVILLQRGIGVKPIPFY